VPLLGARFQYADPGDFPPRLRRDRGWRAEDANGEGDEEPEGAALHGAVLHNGELVLLITGVKLALSS